MTSRLWVNSRRRSTRRRQRAFTLLEILLVLALMVIVGAIAWPSLKAPMENLRLRKAGTQIQAEFGKARMQAMRSGRTQMFQFEVGKDAYTTQTWTGPGDDETSAAGAATAGPAANVATPATMVRNRQGTLPEGIQFLGAETVFDARAASRIQSGGAGANQPDPVLFYADGTTSNAHIVLANSRNRCVVVSLRGLTGMALVSDVKAVDEVRQ